MPTDVVMPQMGESIAEGTVVKWLKKIGETVERDEPLLEISTDKVDAEIPSPSSGTLTEIIAQEGQTVGVSTVVARIGADGEAAGASAPAPPQPAAAAAKPEPAPAPTPEPPAQIDTQRPETRVEPPPPQAAAATEQSEDENIASLDERRRTKSSPLVRKIAQENNVDISRLQGSGVSGRVTKNDILDFLQQPKPAASQQQPAPPQPAPRPAAMTFASGENNRIEPLSVMRKKIAQHMALSKQTSAHVTTAFEVDFTAIDTPPRQHKDASTARGERARTKKLAPDDVQGGTFTITNPGIYGGLFGTPIINQPQVAILGVGGVKKRPVVVETKEGDFIAIRSMCILSLTFDHRLIDGAVADQFMAKVKAFLEAGQFTL